MGDSGRCGRLFSALRLWKIGYTRAERNDMGNWFARFLSRLRVPGKFDLPLFLYCLILTLIGIVFSSSAHITSDPDVVSEVTVSAVKQTLFFLASLLAMQFVSNWYSFEKVQKRIRAWYVLVLFLLLACLAMPSINNANAWLVIPGLGITVQPAEFAKVVMILLAAACCTGSVKGKTAWEILALPVGGALVYAAVIWRMQNDFGSALVVLLITYLVLFLPSARQLRKFQKWMAGLGVIAVVLVAYCSSEAGQGLLEKLPLAQYQIERFKSVSTPFGDNFYGSGYQVGNSLIAFSRGGLTGVGLGKSIQKFGYLPEAYSDFVIAVIAEEGGAIMLGVVFFLYGAIIYRLMAYAFRMRRTENKMILFGTACYAGVHFLLNVGGASAFIPLTGVPLLMLSAGGSSMLAWYILLGICEAVIAAYRRGEEAGI